MTVAKLTGFREASRQLNDMKKAVAQGVGRRALQAPAGVLRDEMKRRVNKLTGATEEAITITKEKTAKGRPQVSVTAADIAAVALELGNHREPAQPFARPAKEAKKGEMLAVFGAALKVEVDATVLRAAKRAAKAAGTPG